MRTEATATETTAAAPDTKKASKKAGKPTAKKTGKPAPPSLIYYINRRLSTGKTVEG